ncbi:MAG: hypothetical protein R2752_17715 [Vicinamibacterales bacterium]
MRCRPGLRVVLVVALGAAAWSVTSGATPTFYDDDPIQVEPITQDASGAARYEPDLIYQTLEGLFDGRPVSDERARDVNTVDEVPDGPFYVNRAGHLPLTPALVARGANTSDGPAPGAWSVVSAKSDGITLGFTIRDAAGVLWFIKFDPPGWRGMATGTEVVAAKLFWAVGYHTVEYHIGRLRASDLTIASGATITPAGEAERAMVPDDVGRLLARADRDADGTYRVILSRAAPGRPVGRIRFAGTRADDPNDVVPHEHRRELRGYRVFAAWLNHVDAKGINSLAALVTEGGRTFIRRYLLDFGSALGSAATGPREGWEGSEPLVEDRGDILRRTLGFGFVIPAWRTARWYESPAVGRLPRSHDDWRPEDWQPHIMNAAFRHLRADDAFWAAEKLTYVTDDIIAAAVAAGEFGNPAAEAELARTIRERRDRILQTWLPAIDPIGRPALTAGGLTFDNAAVRAGVAPAPPGYRARWSRFDNATGAASPIGETTGAAAPLAVPDLSGLEFVQVEISAVDPAVAAWARPVVVHFRRRGGQWQWVGLVRLP